MQVVSTCDGAVIGGESIKHIRIGSAEVACEGRDEAKNDPSVHASLYQDKSRPPPAGRASVQTSCRVPESCFQEPELTRYYPLHRRAKGCGRGPYARGVVAYRECPLLARCPFGEVTMEPLTRGRTRPTFKNHHSSNLLEGDAY